MKKTKVLHEWQYPLTDAPEGFWDKIEDGQWHSIMVICEDGKKAWYLDGKEMSHVK